MNNTFDYEKHIYSTTDIHVGKLNLREHGTTKLYVLDDINESNYYDIIKFVLINKFNSPNTNTVKFLIDCKIVLFENLKFEDLKDMEYGYIFCIML